MRLKKTKGLKVKLGSLTLVSWLIHLKLVYIMEMRRINTVCQQKIKWVKHGAKTIMDRHINVVCQQVTNKMLEHAMICLGIHIYI